MNTKGDREGPYRQAGRISGLARFVWQAERMIDSVASELGGKDAGALKMVQSRTRAAEEDLACAGSTQDAGQERDRRGCRRCGNTKSVRQADVTRLMTIRPLPVLLSAAFLAGAAAGGLAALAAQSEAEPDLAALKAAFRSRWRFRSWATMARSQAQPR
jgi:hypothetical protein